MSSLHKQVIRARRQRKSHGILVLSMPSNYLSGYATEEQVFLRDHLVLQAKRAVEKSVAIVIPSDTDDNGKPYFSLVRL